MTTYAPIPGVTISTSTGTVSGITVGRSQFYILVGVGDDTAEDAPDVNEPVRIETRRDVDEKFGEDSDIADQYEMALANGADPELIHGIRVETSGLTETVTGTDQLSESPVLPNSVTCETTDVEASLKYESPPPVAGENEVFVNPNTGEVDVDSALTDADISVTYPDYESGIDAAGSVLNEAEFGVISVFSGSSDVNDYLLDQITMWREDQLKMFVAIGSVEANATGAGGVPELDTSGLDWDETDPDAPYPEDYLFNDYNNYDVEPENDRAVDAFFLTGPTATDELADNASYGVEALGAVAGKMAGNDTTEPVYDSVIQGLSGLGQDTTQSTSVDLRAEYIMPLRDTGTIRLEDNHSVYDQRSRGGWERDYFRRRIVDLVTVSSYLIARAEMGSILDSDTVSDVDEELTIQLTDFVEDGLLASGEQSVEVFRVDSRTIGINLNIKPLGVAKGADISIEIDA